MAKAIKFISVMILFLSLFLVAMNVDGKLFYIIYKFPYFIQNIFTCFN
jgi:hypothetical protein